MRFLHWLRRAVRRLDRAAEETALAASVQAEGGSAPQVSAMGSTALIGEIEQDEREAQE